MNVTRHSPRERLEGIRAVLFDLDDTLLHVEMKRFIPSYLTALGAYFGDLVPLGRFREAMLASTLELLDADDGSCSNQRLFLRGMDRRLGLRPEQFEIRFQRFCEQGLSRLEPQITPIPLAQEILRTCFDQGLKVVIATNPVFPRPVIDARIRWGKLDAFPYDFITSYENSRYCKPHRRYYEDILETMKLEAGQCLMVGNDTSHDLSAREVGIATYLLDTYICNRTQDPPVYDFKGGHAQLLHFLGCWDATAIC